ncbi:4-hydroxybenzoate 3-monooxygenase [Streptomyces axinellae]|uniref:4-hydroxybenzoate 3-monooxygenase n=1 Tax=Streptomyces axinellae TaxID=552788 RepID=A0ABN3PZA8_9ACTN
MSGTRRLVRTEVGIVGAGPAGLVLANVLLAAGIDAYVVERGSRAEAEQRARAGLLEHQVVEYLRAHGLADRLLAEGTRHGWCEFLCEGDRLRFDYAARTGGAQHWVYPQQFLVRDLIARLEEAGRLPFFGCPATAVHPAPDGGGGTGAGRTGAEESGATGAGAARIECAELTVECDYVVGCDGRHGIARAALPEDMRGELTHRYPYDWLTLLTEVDRQVEGVLYAVHEDGFAGVMPRTGGLARVYLQVPAGDEAGRWPEARARERLAARLSGARDALPRVGRVLEAGVLRMRGAVGRHLRYGRLFLAGDAAHLLTPSGAKGLNLAVADAADLAHALVRHYRDGDVAELETYSRRRLAHAWRVQEFSDQLLRLLHLSAPEASGGAPFTLRLKRERIQRLIEPGPTGAVFAREYVGSGATVPGPAAPPLPPPSPTPSSPGSPCPDSSRPGSPCTGSSCPVEAAR